MNTENKSRLELLLEALANGDPIDFEPTSRMESYLLALLNGEIPTTTPQSRAEVLLQALCEKGISGGSGSGDDTGETEPSVDLTLATATADDIRSGLTAYTADGLVTGTAERSLKKLLDATKSCYYLFRNYNGENITDVIEKIDTSVVTNMIGMFYNCSNLTSIPELDTSVVTNMTSMFESCSKLTSIPELDTSAVTSMGSMFKRCSNLTSIPELDTSVVTNMTSMFESCSNLTSIPELYTSAVTSMPGMFESCSNLTSIPELDVRKVTSITGFVRKCSSLTEIWIKNIKVALQVGSATSWGHLLTYDSLLHLLKELIDTGSSKTLTVGSANLEKLADTYVKLITITDEMIAEDEFIELKLPFEVCESTDEGGMDVETYLLAKNWNIA